METAARRVSWRNGTVAVEAHVIAGPSRTYRARAAILTLPVGVLKSSEDDSGITFDPELPAAKRDALDHLEMGQVVKISLLFRTAFWEQIEGGRYRDAAFFRLEGAPFTGYWTRAPLRSKTIVAWAGGPKAMALQGASDKRLFDLALSQFAGLFGDPSVACDAYVRARKHD